MSWVGVVGILLGLLAYPWATIRRERRDFAFFMILYLLHVAAGIFSYQLAQTGASDSALYYYDPGHFYGNGFGLSTGFVIYMVQWMRGLIGGTYLDYFLLFQAFGFFGIATLMRIFQEIYEEIGQPQPVFTYLLLFLPGLHFWTSSIGKDAPLFFGACLALWASMRLTRRYIVFGAAIVIMMVFRPHIAMLAMAAGSVAILFEKRTRPALKFALFCIAVVGTGVVASSLGSTLGLDLTNADAVSTYISSREEVTLRAQEGMNTAVLGASFPVKLFSLLFRPLFLDAAGALAYLASLENLAFLGLFLATFANVPRLLAVTRNILFARYALFFFLFVAFLLAFVYYNVGLGLRQKTMFVPAILVLFVAGQAVARSVRTIRPPPVAQAN
ncbi:MAG TPA: hypothetical protein VEW25_03820 [Allosphingosinicella sp.]|nr:hypothetical protein [Allosphingosinicella sp.]